jgi:cytochrome P450
MFAGGTDTTATTLEWAMTELMKNPSIMKKAQEEVRRVAGKKSKLDGDDITHMHYLKCIIKETLRLHAPVPLLVPRENSASVKLGGYDIPAKTSVYVNAWAIQRDEFCFQFIFHLKISHFKSHLLRKSMNLYVKNNVKILFK